MPRPIWSLTLGNCITLLLPQFSYSVSRPDNHRALRALTMTSWSTIHKNTLWLFVCIQRNWWYGNWEVWAMGYCGRGCGFCSSGCGVMIFTAQGLMWMPQSLSQVPASPVSRNWCSPELLFIILDGWGWRVWLSERPVFSLHGLGYVLSEVGIKSMEEPFPIQLGAVGFCTLSSSVQTWDREARSRTLNLTGVILHPYLLHLLHFPSFSLLYMAPNPGHFRNCILRFAKKVIHFLTILGCLYFYIRGSISFFL